MASTSAITNAFAGRTKSVDIPRFTTYNGKAAGAGARARNIDHQQPNNFLTPPNSVSPSLPPQGFRRQPAPPSGLAPSLEVDSEADIHDDEQDNFSASDMDGQIVSLDSSGAITPALLARHHLPEILLKHGPLAIRHVMSYLTISVPGFSGIPPAKARRLVVGALEGKGNGSNAASYHNEVIFEKVGWGRWDARVQGQPPRDSSLGGTANPSPPSSVPSSLSALSTVGISIPHNTMRRGNHMSRHSKSWTGESTGFSLDEIDMDLQGGTTMLEHEADKMSLDGASSSEASDDLIEEDEAGDATDEEDWASIGAEALRRGSNSASANNRNYMAIKLPLRHRGGPSSSSLAKSSPAVHNSSFYRSRVTPGGQSAVGVAFNSLSDSQEREAIEALVALRSV
jgi:hypothetical protein